MTVLETLGIFNYGLVLIYGLFLSTDISGGWDGPQQKRVIFLLCPLFLLIQWLCWLIFGVETATQLYPLIVHLPLALILIFVLKRHFGTALVSVFTAYLCCQLPRWVKLLALAFTASPLAGEVSYALSIIPIFFLLRRFFVQAAHSAMTYSRSSLLLFGSLPFAYYCFDYATTVYSDALNINIHVLTEFLPTALIVFYVVFLAAYHAQTQNRTQAELQQSMLKTELKQSSAELANLRRIETQTAIYQHDMRHHLVVIDGFLSTDSPDLAREYIHKIQSDVESITSKRYCENELVNLLCSSFSAKAARSGVRLDIKARLSNGLSIPAKTLRSRLTRPMPPPFSHNTPPVGFRQRFSAKYPHIPA